MMETSPAARQHREVILGGNSSVWRALQSHPLIAQRRWNAIRHGEVASFAFEPGDRVWVFAYSLVLADNLAMLALLRLADVSEIIYVSSSSTIVCGTTRCYAYPNAKHHAEQAALALANSRILTLGQIYARASQLPAGLSMATSIDQLASFMTQPEWPAGCGRAKNLFEPVLRPFGASLEAGMYRVYGRVLTICGRWPCVLRPIDLVLRAVGWRWYGYVFLSNRLWTATIS